MKDYSVVIRTKNSEKTIKDCLDSVFMQTVKPKEVVLVDSDSNDKTLEIVSNYSVKVIYYPKNIDFNYSKSLNIGISNLTAEYILILSSHVRFLNTRAVELMLSVFSNHKKNVSVSYWRTDKEKNSEEKENVVLDCININNFEGKAMFNFCSMIKKSSWIIKHFNEDLPTCEDQEWSYSYLKKGYQSVFIKEPKVFYKNYFYNYKKDVNETFTIGRVVYPKFISKKYMIDSIKKGYKNLKRRNIYLAKYHLLLSWYIFRFRVFGYYKNSSLYNKKLK